MKLSSIITILYIVCIGLVFFVSQWYFPSVIIIGYIGFLSLTVLVTVSKFGYGTSLNDIRGQFGALSVSTATVFGLVSLLLLTRLDYYAREFLFNWGRVVTVVLGVGVATFAVLIGPRVNSMYLSNDYDDDDPFPVE
ncbi:MAG: hypothetical protein RTU30_11140 [Candidatus Thorarchaeota archaeon]